MTTLLTSPKQIEGSPKWHVKRGIPIFEPHIRKDKDGQAKFQVIHEQRLHDTAPVFTLQEIMEACEKRGAPGKRRSCLGRIMAPWLWLFRAPAKAP